MKSLKYLKSLKTLKWLPALGAVALLVLSAWPALGAGRKADKGGRERHDAARWQAEADSRKADYYYMEALRQEALDNNDAYFELLQRAWELDSTDTSVGQKLGYYMFALGQQDSTLAARGFSLMRNHFERVPDDYYASATYGFINSRLGNAAEAARVWTRLDSLFPRKTDVTMALADALQALRDTASLRSSLGVLSRLERSQGAALPFTAKKVRALLVLGDTLGAIGEVRSLMASSPRSSNYSVYAGDLFSALEMGDSALAYYDRACRVDSANGLAYYKRAEYFRERGDSASYDREVFRALRQETLDLDVKMEMLGSYVRQLYTDSAQQPRIEQLFDQLLVQHPHEAQIRDLYSSYLVALGRYVAAAEQQRFALDTDPANEERWQAVMSLYASADSFPRAVATGQTALHYFPQSSPINLMIGANYQQMNDYDQALRYFAAADSLCEPSDLHTRSQIVASMGDVYYSQGKTDDAFVQYNLALELDPENLLAMNNCAYYLAEQNRDLDRAEKLAAICVRANPENDTALDTYAWVYFKKKDYARAKELIDRAVALEEQDPQADVLHHAGDIYYMNGEPEAALAFWQRALALDPDNLLLQKKVKHKTHFFE